jgi:hypothetical protein
VKYIIRITQPPTPSHLSLALSYEEREKEKLLFLEGE